MNQTKCGHKESVTTYTVSADPKAVLAWYAQRMPGGIQIDAGRAFRTHIMTSNEIFAPDGASAVGVTQPSAAAMGGKSQPVYIGIGTYDPPLSADEMHTMEDITGTDPAAKQKAIAAMKAEMRPGQRKSVLLVQPHEVEKRLEVFLVDFHADALGVVADVVEIHAGGHHQSVLFGFLAKDRDVVLIVQRIKHFEAL